MEENTAPPKPQTQTPQQPQNTGNPPIKTPEVKKAEAPKPPAPPEKAQPPRPETSKPEGEKPLDTPSEKKTQSKETPPAENKKEQKKHGKITKIMGPKEEKKKPNFKKLLLMPIILLVLGSVTLLAITLNSKLRNGATNREKMDDEEQESTASVEIITETNPFETYTNDIYGFSFTYPGDLKLEQLGAFSEDPLQYRVIYKGKNQETDPKTEDDLTDGYIFKVIVHENITIPLASIVSAKKEKFTLTCTSNTEITKTTNTTLDSKSGYTFEVTNCPPDYKETLLQVGDTVLEIVQIHRGDLGIRQQYKTQTEEILKTFSLEEDSPKEDGFITFSTDAYGFSFKYRDLNSTCCSMTNLKGENIKRLIVLADKEPNVKEFDGAFDGIGIFIDQNSEKTGFDLYLNTQKQNLIQEYKLVMGKNPETSEEAINVGTQTGVYLQGYAWWGDLIYVQLPNQDEILIIAKTQDSSQGLGETFTNILNTFEFEE